ncbi:NAD-dependent epimerase/dehydratase family protein [Crocinitomicaceae bacterium]|jgi:nucleoside-diphosphate-sugar epimerase|nr:NAD-dependent epimerase/dehydratase family protein [Crocinitomicaceae bacterium]
MSKILIIGSCGQIGIELVLELRKIYGNQNVIASDIKEEHPISIAGGPYYQLDIMNVQKLKAIVKENDIKEIYLLAALLSATAEKKPLFAWDLNMQGLFNVLELAKDKLINKVFWPSSIAVFGSNSPANRTPQHTVMEPSTVYGISKLAGERWCEYYHNKYGVDVRSIRYPGLISYKSAPGGGTTDYAVDIFIQALKSKNYTCYLRKDAKLPMMYMSDAIRATIEIMEAPPSSIKIRSSYNLSGISFDPNEITNAIRREIPEFKIKYEPDFRQQIAESWPNSVDDSCAKTDWKWENKVGLQEIVKKMLKGLSQ